MDTNRISAVVSAADRAAQSQAVETLVTTQPYLKSLTKEERVKMLKAGSDSLDFAARLLPIAEKNKQYLPPVFDLAEWTRDVELMQAVRGLLDELSPLVEKMEDTLMLAGSEAYAGALTAYGYLKQAKVGGDLEILMDDLGKRFARKSRAVPTPKPVENGQ